MNFKEVYFKRNLTHHKEIYNHKHTYVIKLHIKKIMLHRNETPGVQKYFWRIIEELVHQRVRIVFDTL